MNEKLPDRIWISFPIEEDMVHSIPGMWSEKLINGFTDIGPFLKSAPARVHAEEMKTILGKILKRDTIAGYRQVIRDVLNEIEAEEQEK